MRATQVPIQLGITDLAGSAIWCPTPQMPPGAAHALVVPWKMPIGDEPPQWSYTPLDLDSPEKGGTLEINGYFLTSQLGSAISPGALDSLIAATDVSEAAAVLLTFVSKTAFAIEQASTPGLVLTINTDGNATQFSALQENADHLPILQRFQSDWS